jgi:hypothetical protein
MKLLGKWIALAGSAILGTVACSASNSASSFEGFTSNSGPNPGVAFGDATAGGAGFASAACTEDAGVLTPIGPQGCAPNQTLVYRKPVAGSGASGIAGGASDAATPMSASLAACTNTKCGPGQVAVVTYQATGSSGPSSADGGALDDAATAFGDSEAPVSDGGPATESDGAGSIAKDGAAPSSVDAALLPDAEAPDASPLATADASDDATATATADDAGVIGIPCGAIVTCVDQPPTCPSGQSPSYTPNGRWHCMPLCDSNDGTTVVITYGASYGNTTICAGAPPTTACPTAGDVWTWDFNNEEWVCSPECDNGQYDQHDYGGQTVCVPC